MTSLNLPDIPTSPMYIGDIGKVMTVEWQEFFRSLFDRVGGYSSHTIIETDIASVSSLYTVINNCCKKIDELEKKLYFLENIDRLPMIEDLVKIVSIFGLYIPSEYKLLDTNTGTAPAGDHTGGPWGNIGPTGISTQRKSFVAKS